MQAAAWADRVLSLAAEVGWEAMWWVTPPPELVKARKGLAQVYDLLTAYRKKSPSERMLE
jgi:hypothetical protein